MGTANIYLQVLAVFSNILLMLIEMKKSANLTGSVLDYAGGRRIFLTSLLRVLFRGVKLMDYDSCQKDFIIKKDCTIICIPALFF